MADENVEKVTDKNNKDNDDAQEEGDESKDGKIAEGEESKDGKIAEDEINEPEKSETKKEEDDNKMEEEIRKMETNKEKQGNAEDEEEMKDSLKIEVESRRQSTVSERNGINNQYNEYMDEKYILSHRKRPSQVSTTTTTGEADKDIAILAAEYVDNIRIADRIKSKKGSRHRKKIQSDYDDAYSVKERTIMESCDFNPLKIEAKVKETKKYSKARSVLQRLEHERADNPILRKRIQDDIERNRVEYEDIEVYLAELKAKKKEEYFDDEDLYGSDESDTEIMMKKSRPKKKSSVAASKLNLQSIDRRAQILKQMQREYETIDEMDRKEEEKRIAAIKKLKEKEEKKKNKYVAAHE